MVKMLDCGATSPGFNPRPSQVFFSLFYMDTKVIEVIKNHRPISHGPFFCRRSVGPSPSCSQQEAAKRYQRLQSSLKALGGLYGPAKAGCNATRRVCNKAQVIQSLLVPLLPSGAASLFFLFILRSTSFSRAEQELQGEQNITYFANRYCLNLFYPP